MATPRSTRNPLFLGRWFQDEVIIVAVRWYLTYPLSYRQVCEMLRDRGVSVAPSTVMRWVLRYAPEFEKRWQRYEKPVALSWRVDETYIKVGGHWTYLYRAVDQNGKSVDFFLRKRRDLGAAKTFFRRALKKHGDPLSITLDAYAASHRAVKELKESGEILYQKMRVRSCAYLNGQERRNRQKYTLRGPKRALTPKQGSEGVRPGEFRKVSYAVLASSESLNICRGRRILMSLLCCRQ